MKLQTLIGKGLFSLCLVSSVAIAMESKYYESKMIQEKPYQLGSSEMVSYPSQWAMEAKEGKGSVGSPLGGPITEPFKLTITNKTPGLLISYMQGQKNFKTGEVSGYWAALNPQQSYQDEWSNLEKMGPNPHEFFRTYDNKIYLLDFEKYQVHPKSQAHYFIAKLYQLTGNLPKIDSNKIRNAEDIKIVLKKIIEAEPYLNKQPISEPQKIWRDNIISVTIDNNTAGLNVTKK
jgi:hypothetical protein